jgi:hypothetical protein
MSSRRRCGYALAYAGAAAWMPRTPFMARCAPPPRSITSRLIFFAMIAASLGARDAAFGWLEQAYRERSGWLVFLKHDPLADALCTDARFSELLRRVGLKPMSLKNP